MRWLLLAAVLAAGCGGGGAAAGEDLIGHVRVFQEGLRWRRYDQAADHVPAPVRARFLDAHDELDRELRIDDYEIVRVTLAGKTEATVRVRYTWHLESVGRVHETTVDERWRRQGKVWRIVSADHRHGEPLPPGTLALTAP
jgi:hypothetical protein